MSARRIALPNLAEVQAAIATERAESGRDPSVPGVARRLGLANTTFRRHFPASAPSSPLRTPHRRVVTPPGPTARPRTRPRGYGRPNRELTEQLEFALAAIQRLSIDNARLIEALHQARSVTRLPRPRPAGS